MAFSLPSQAQEFNLDSLLLKSVGGQNALERLKRVSSYSANGTALSSGQPATFSFCFSAPDKFFLEISLGALTFAQGYDGKIAWQKDHNGSITELSGFERRVLLEQVYFQSYSYLFQDRLKGGREYRGRTTRDGKSYHEVALYPFNNDTVIVLFDIATGLPHLLESDFDNIKSVTYSEDFREVEKVIIPFVSRTVTIDTPIESEFTITKVDLNAVCADSLFSMIGGALGDYRFPEGVDKLIVPFEYKGGHLYVSATVNGNKKMKFILDSGSSANIINKAAADMLKLPVVGTVQARGIGGFAEVQLVETDSIQLDGLTLLGQVAGSLDLSDIGQSSDGDNVYGGILGYDFMSRFPLLIDYAASTVTIYNPATYAPPDSGVLVPFRMVSNVPTIRAEIEGIAGDFIVDIGNAFGLIIHEDFAQKTKLYDSLQDVKTTRSTISGIGGEAGSKTAFASHFQFGSIALDSLRVILTEKGAGITGSNELAGNIGNLILKQFKVLFDYEHQSLIFLRP